MRNFNRMKRTFSEFNEWFESKMLLVSIRRGLTYMIPILLIGSMALVFTSLPIPAYQNLMKGAFGSQWKNIFLCISDGTSNIIALILVICISHAYVAEYSEYHDYSVSPVIAASVSLGSFAAISGISKVGYNLESFGAVGVFFAMIVAVTSSMLFLKLSSIKSLRMKAFTDGTNSAFNYALASIYPAAITIAVFAVMSQILRGIFGITDLQRFISNFFCVLFLKIRSPFFSAILFISMVHILWFFGFHGSDILEPVAQGIFSPASAINQYMIEAGKVPTHIFTKTFFDTFVLMGGCGAALCLICAIMIDGRNKSQLQLAKLSLTPVMFNINELLVFGIPIVLNPVYIVPFLFVPIILTVSSFLAMKLGLVPYTCKLVEWTTPIFLSGYASTQSISGSILQLFNLVLGTICYIPFVKLARGISEGHTKNSIKKVYDLYRQVEQRGLASAFLTRHDDIGNISRSLAADLEYDLQNNNINLFYQPQVDYDGHVFGVEALLRWNHDSYGYIYPPLIITLAEEAQLIDKLGCWILDTACRDLGKMHGLGLRDIAVSVNVSAPQLENDFFTESFQEIISKYDINPCSVKIEVTEQLALTGSKRVIDQMSTLRELGIKLEMDDFGMGHSSLMYLKEYDFDTIKLDGSLIREIISSSSCRNIISSIVLLGKSLNYKVIAEFVENEEQRAILHELGCDRYQGYLYSKAVPYNELIEYILNNNKHGISEIS